MAFLSFITDIAQLVIWILIFCVLRSILGELMLITTTATSILDRLDHLTEDARKNIKFWVGR